MRVFLQAAGDLFLTSLFLTGKMLKLLFMYYTGFFQVIILFSQFQPAQGANSDKRANLYNKRQIVMIKLTSRGQF